MNNLKIGDCLERTIATIESLKGEYVLIKYTVKNKNLRCISDMDMSRGLLRLGRLSF